MEQMHSLLKRQLKRYFGGTYTISKEWEGFIDAVNNAYKEFDVDRTMLERSLDLSSHELLQANSEMRAIFQAIPDLLFRLDSEGTILDCKAGDTTDLFLPIEKLPGKRIQDVPPKNVGNKFFESIQRVRRTKSITSIEYSLQIHGYEYFYEARLLPLLENQIIVIIRNITERKQIEEEILKTSKLESIGILAGGIAHDFNNILTAIIGNISLAKMNANPGCEIFKSLTEAEKACLRAQGLTQQLLTFSKGGAPVKKVTSIAGLLKDSASFVLSGSNVCCEFYIPNSLLPVDIDEGQINQIINNLVINAQQSMPQGGTIKIQAENVTVSREMKEYSQPLQDGKYVMITIQDQGIGIPSEHLDKIFDPYFTTKQKSSGLGLTTTYAIIKNHAGYITVKSRVGVGTTFCIYLPVSPKALIVKDTEERVFIGKGRILVMDDEEIIRDVACKMLSRLGYEVDFARDGAEAIEFYQKAKNEGKPFNAVIMDLTISGGMGGKEAIQRLLEIDPEVKAIVSSGYSNDPLMSDFKQHGFKGVIAKPYTIGKMSEALNRVIMGYTPIR